MHEGVKRFCPQDHSFYVVALLKLYTRHCVAALRENADHVRQLRKEVRADFGSTLLIMATEGPSSVAGSGLHARHVGL